MRLVRGAGRLYRAARPVVTRWLRDIRRGLVVATPAALVVAGLACFTLAAFLQSTTWGLVVAGVSVFYLEWLQRG